MQLQAASLSTSNKVLELPVSAEHKDWLGRCCGRWFGRWGSNGSSSRLLASVVIRRFPGRSRFGRSPPYHYLQ